MRVLYSPSAFVFRCSKCDTVIEIPKDEYFFVEDWWMIFDEKVPDILKSGNWAGEDKWVKEHTVSCPTCGVGIDRDEDRIKETVQINKQSKERCEHCNTVLGKDDKFCNSCGAPI